MFKSYLKIAFRNFIKNKSHTLINVGGLTLGIVCALVIFLVIQFDLSFDTWHEHDERIYRVVRETTEFGDTSYDVGGPYPFAETIEKEITGLEYVTLVDNNYGNDPVISYVEDGKIRKKFKEENIAFVEQEYFNIFTYQWIAGNAETALKRPNTVVITESFAQKLFGHLDVIGKNIVVNSSSTADFEVTGLVKDPPRTTDFNFTFFGSSHSKDRQGRGMGFDSWTANSSGLQTYVKLLPGVSPEKVNAQFDPLYAKYNSEERAEVVEFYLQPLSDIHFNSRFNNYSDRVVEKRNLYALGIIGLFLLITACINFINLNTAIAVTRSKEVGLRKTLGGTRTQLTFHFLGETAFVTFVSVILGVGITEVVLQGIEPLLGFKPELNLLSNTTMFLFLGVMFVVITVAAGWYPARNLSGFRPIEAIRNKINASYGKGLTLRRSLIVLQFTITQVLIICTIVIATQVKYFQSKDLGFTQDALIQVDIPTRDKQKLETFKSQLKNESSIHNVTFSNTGTTSNNVWGGNYVLTGDSIRIENDAQIKFIDQDFLDTYEIELLAGRNVLPSDTVRSYLVNESLAKQAGFTDRYDEIVGKSIQFWGVEAPVIGVVNDFNTQSLHEGLSPVVMATRFSGYYLSAIKINSQRTSEALATIKNVYTDAFPEFVFEYTFLDEKIAQLYETEQRTAGIMNAFTLIAILIGCLGLFGLVSYMATTRTKEIGVRKVLGAGIIDILSIFGKELAILTGISFALAAPVSWYLMQKWLTDFAYRIDLGPGIFIAAFGGTILIALFTVGYKSIKAALTNPVESLKSE